MKKLLTSILFIMVMVMTLPLNSVFAATTTPFSYSTWMPYWKKVTSVQEVSAHLSLFKDLSPFAFEVKSDGTLGDTLKITQDPWPGLIAQAKASNIKLLPTVSWADGDAIQTTLASSTLRTAHEQQIMAMVFAGGFDGADIDYENKKAATNPYFSKFLKELSTQLHAVKKTLSCTTEPRTPATSRFVKVPKVIEYSNDYVMINKYCDQVRIMAYGQGNIDLKLNKTKGGKNLYMPVADPDWVKKVIAETARTISLKKIVLGIPTYGYEYEITPKGSSYTYRTIRSINYRDAIALAQTVGTVPVRNTANELSFTYATSSSMLTEAPAVAPTSSQRLVWFPDAQSIVKNIAVAKQAKIKGAIFFKIDGDGDPTLWNNL